MTDIFLDIDETNHVEHHDSLCIRKYYTVATAPDKKTGDEFIKQFFVIKMEDKNERE